MADSKLALSLTSIWDGWNPGRVNIDLEGIKNTVVENKLLTAAAATTSLVSFGFIYYVYSQYRLYQKYKHIPGPGINNFMELLFGNYKELEEVADRKKIMSEKIQELCQKYGPVIKIHIMNKVLLAANDPDAVKLVIMDQDAPKEDSVYKRIGYPYNRRFLGRGLVSEVDKERWRKNRALLNHLFHRNNLEKYTEEFNSQGNLMMEKLRNMADGKQYIRMLDQFNRATLDVIGKVAFGLNINSLEDSTVELNVQLTTALQGLTELFFNPLFELIPANRSKVIRYRKSIDNLREFAKQKILNRIKEMQADGYVPNDMFSTLFKTSKEDQLDFEVLIDEFLTLFAAGQETTAVALTFSVLELGRNPDVLNKLKEEVDRVLGHRRDITNEDLTKLEYTGWVFKESLRKWPPAALISRTSSSDLNIGGYFVPKNSWVAFSQFVAGNDPKNFPEPEKFNPERFKDNVSVYQYFPFSLGPRNCIGQNFAQIEGKVLLAKFVQSFDLELDQTQSFAIEECATIRPVDGCRVRLTLRQ